MCNSVKYIYLWPTIINRVSIKITKICLVWLLFEQMYLLEFAKESREHFGIFINLWIFFTSLVPVVSFVGDIME